MVPAPPPPSSSPSASSRFAARFPALAHRDFRLLWFGQMVSLAGSQMQSVAIGWEIYERTSSPAMLGLVGLARVVPIVIFSLIGGVIADSFGRRRILYVTQSVMLLAALALGTAAWSGVSTPALILTLTAISAAAGSFDNPARQALLPNLVPPEHLTSAVSLNTVMFQTSMILGPALAGLVIGKAGVAAVYWINAGSFLAVLTALVLMRVNEPAGPGRAHVTVGTFLDGLRFVRSSKLIYSTMLLDFFATFFASATALLPVFAKDILHVGASGLGMLYSAEAVGSLIAGAAMSLLGDPKHKGRLLLASVAIYGAATVLYGFSTSYLLSLFLLGLVGAGDSVSTVLRSTIRQVATPDHIRGRMTSVNMIFFMGGPQLGNLEAGLVAGLIGAPLAVVTGGVATIALVGVAAWLFPQLRDYR